MGFTQHQMSCEPAHLADCIPRLQHGAASLIVHLSKQIAQIYCGLHDLPTISQHPLAVGPVTVL